MYILRARNVQVDFCSSLKVLLVTGLVEGQLFWFILYVECNNV